MSTDACSVDTARETRVSGCRQREECNHGGHDRIRQLHCLQHTFDMLATDAGADAVLPSRYKGVQRLERN